MATLRERTEWSKCMLLTDIKIYKYIISYK